MSFPSFQNNAIMDDARTFLSDPKNKTPATKKQRHDPHMSGRRGKKSQGIYVPNTNK
jgi:hypothetical protein